MKVKANLLAYALMIRKLQSGASSSDLVESTGLGINAVRLHIAHLRHVGAVRIAAWRRTPIKKHPVPVYRLEQGIDVERPLPLSTLRKKS